MDASFARIVKVSEKISKFLNIERVSEIVRNQTHYERLITKNASMKISKIKSVATNPLERDLVRIQTIVKRLKAVEENHKKMKFYLDEMVK